MFFSPTQRANRRKFLVFPGTFLALAVIGLFYSYSRPAIYLASARVHINPGAVQVEAAVSTGGTQGANVPRSLLNELQVLTSRPLVKAVLEKMPDTQRDTVPSWERTRLPPCKRGCKPRWPKARTWSRCHHAAPMLRLLPCWSMNWLLPTPASCTMPMQKL